LEILTPPAENIAAEHARISRSAALLKSHFYAAAPRENERSAVAPLRENLFWYYDIAAVKRAITIFVFVLICWPHLHRHGHRHRSSRSGDRPRQTFHDGRWFAERVC
jgi:hypothetical protein